MLQKHGITSTTPSELMFRAGVVYKNLKFEGDDWVGEVLGATSGGSKFSLVEEFADAEVDGALVKVKGLKVKTGETGTLETNVTEFKEDVIKNSDRKAWRCQFKDIFTSYHKGRSCAAFHECQFTRIQIES